MKTDYLQVLNEALDAGGAALVRHFEQIDEFDTKTSERDLVTVADRESERVIRSILGGRFPDHAVLGEEQGLDGAAQAAYRWIVDPLDGTTNYAHSVPICAVSIALEHNGEIIAAGVYNPIIGEKFLAERGAGATRNGRRIRVSRVDALARSLLVTGFPYSDAKVLQQCLKEVGTFLGKVHSILRLGAAALDMCYVACGRVDVFWQRNLNPWDTAAGWLIAEEAGGRVTDFAGERFSPYRKEVVCSNGTVHQEFLDMLARARED
jgi:myo-inositol-1(or 4)-monophosphatase